ncbi:hypothetical protein FVW27_03665, partial [Desulfovibrio sp. XJ01]|nr:hypothetical protein [Nitratidesulfovibrio liaohensis]
GPGAPVGLDALALRRAREALHALDGLAEHCKAVRPPRREDGAGWVPAGHAPIRPVTPVSPIASSRQGGRT